MIRLSVYYPTTVLPAWMQALSVVSPATYVIRGMRDALLDFKKTSMEAKPWGAREFAIVDGNCNLVWFVEYSA